MSRHAPRHCQHCERARELSIDQQPCPSAPERKAALRRAVLESISSMTPEVRATKSQLIARRVAALEAFKRARTVMAYIAMEMEADPWPIVREAWELDKRVVLPRIHPPLDEPRVPYVHDRALQTRLLRREPVDDPGEHSGLRADVVGILEPKDSAPEVDIAEVDLVLVPCVAYDRKGFRLGKGGGFYDRFLAQPGFQAFTCGLAFSEQVFRHLPICPHDQPVRTVVTDTAVIEIG